MFYTQQLLTILKLAQMETTMSKKKNDISKYVLHLF